MVELKTDNIQPSIFLTEVSFQTKIENMVANGRTNYIEAVLEFCDTNDVEYDVVKKVISSNLRDKIRLNAEDNGSMRYMSRLPI